MKAYLVVIHSRGTLTSKRSDHTWSCLMGKDKKKTIQKAEHLRNTWESQGYGPYELSVGKVSQINQRRTQVTTLYDDALEDALRDPDEGDR